MDNRDELRAFLTSRRARLTPQAVGLPDFGGRRRVPGLRREEVALLAGMSVEYYKRLERGNATGFSDVVLDGIARALQLDEAEHRHLFDLVRTANDGDRPGARRPVARTTQVRPTVQQTIDAMSTVPVFVQNGRLDAVATNALGHALFSVMFATPQKTVNAARYVFLDPSAQEFYRHWEADARQIVAILRAEAGRSPYDKALSGLVGELSTRSDLFRRLWGAHDVKEHRTGSKIIHHPVVGDLDLTFESMELLSNPGLTLLAFSATPGSPSHEGLQLLANWVATDTAHEPTSPLSSDATADN